MSQAVVTHKAVLSAPHSAQKAPVSEAIPSSAALARWPGFPSLKAVPCPPCAALQDPVPWPLHPATPAGSELCGAGLPSLFIPGPVLLAL